MTPSSCERGTIQFVIVAEVNESCRQKKDPKTTKRSKNDAIEKN
ncbi:MAG: hypothetical protein ACJAXZ_000072 [Akkermansiaceae bacterium]|jgi:hypothetical protein